MSNDISLIQAVTYDIPVTDDSKVSLSWPIIASDGPLALIRIDLAVEQSLSFVVSNMTQNAVAALKRCLAYRVDSVFEVVYVAGELRSFANVWVVNQDDSHQDFSLIWNYMSPANVLETRGLPSDLLETSFAAHALPAGLPLSQRQQELIDAKQKTEDTSALLYCQETLQGLLARSPNSIKVEVSEETAIALLAIHGASAARALEGLDRFPD